MARLVLAAAARLRRAASRGARATSPRRFAVNPTRVLVTGGAGFFGMHLARELVRGGDGVRVLDMAEAPSWVAELGIDYRRGDVRDGAVMDDALQGVDALVHAAFAPPQRS